MWAGLGTGLDFADTFGHTGGGTAYIVIASTEEACGKFLPQYATAREI
jgi:hypothetical protein